VIKALVVEDERIISSIIEACLQRQAIAATIIDNAATALRLVENNNFDIAIIDINLPGMSGLELIMRIRLKQIAYLPIMIVTQNTEKTDRIVGYDCGADDYLCKPFDNEELLARVRALLRRRRFLSEAVTTIYKYNGWTFNPQTRELMLDGRQLYLTPKEYELFTLFIKHPGRTFTRSEIEDILWRGFKVESNRFIDQHVKNIKKKIQEIEPGYNCIETVWGVGYKFG
jgi:DNA-binding response OmpR family regulator